MKLDELTEAELEALCHDRLDLLSPERRASLEAARAEEGDELDEDGLESMLEVERALSKDATLALRRVAPELPDLDLMVSRAMANAPDPSTLPATRRSLLFGAIGGVLVASVSGGLAVARHLSSTGGVLDPWRDATGGARTALTVGTALDRAVSVLPGGWTMIGLVGLAVLAALSSPLRTLALGRAPKTAGALALALAMLVSGRALAWDAAGQWPQEDASVSVDVEQVPLSHALHELARSASLGMTYSLPEDPSVSAHLSGVPLRVALDALLGDTPARVRHLGSVLVIEAVATRGQAGPRDDAVDVAAPAPPSPPLPMVAPTPPAPPLPPAAVAVVDTSSRAPAPSRDLQDLVTFGNDARVGPGQEVRDVFTMGGDAVIEGRAYGDVVTMGGDADVRGEVIGDVITMGGDITIAEAGRVHGQVQAMGGEVESHGGGGGGGGVAIGSFSEMASEAHEHDDDDDGGFFGQLFSAATQYALLFLLGIVVLGLAPARLGTARAELTTHPIRSLGSGLLGVVAGSVLTLVLLISIVGIPVAFVFGLGSFVASCVGLGISASVIGAALPINRLADKPVHQLAAGVLVLFLVSRVPFIGAVALILGTLAGLGALLVTHGGRHRSDAVPSPFAR